MAKKILFFSAIVTLFILLTVTTESFLEGSNYEIKIVSARIAEKKADGRKWDVYPASPDPFVKIFIGGELILQTSVQTDTYTPSWNEKTNTSYQKKVSIRIEVWDKDAMYNDLIGTWEGNELPEEELSFEQVRELIISIE